MPNYVSPENTNSKLPRVPFAGLSFAGMAAMLGRGILLPILPNLAKNMGASSAIIGAIFAGFALSRGVFSPLLGHISDQHGRKKIIIAGLVLYGLLALGYSRVQNLWLLAVLWFLQGLASAMVAPIAQSYAGDITPEGKEGRVMNFFYFIQFGGAAIGPVIGGYLTDHISAEAPFYVMSGTALTALLVVALAVPGLSFEGGADREKLKLKESFATVFKDYKVRGVLSYLFGRGFYRRGFNAFFPIYAVTIADLSQSQVGVILSCYMLTGVLLQYPFGWLTDRWKEHRAELVGIGGFVAGLTMFVFPSLTTLSWLIVLVVVKGVFSTFSRAPAVAIRTERGRIYGMGAVTGASIAASSAGQVLGPIGFGAMSDLFHIWGAFYFGGFAALLTTGVAYWYLRFKKEKT